MVSYHKLLLFYIAILDQVLVETCLEHGTTYEVKIKIVNDSNCDPGILTLTTVFAVSTCQNYSILKRV